MANRIEKLQKLHETDPTDPFCPYGIGLELEKEQQYDEAIAWLDKAIQIDPYYAYAWFHKGRVLHEAGRAADARRTLGNGIRYAREHGSEESVHAAEEMQGLLETIPAEG